MSTLKTPHTLALDVSMKNKRWQWFLGAFLLFGVVGGTAAALALNDGEEVEEYPCNGEAL